MSNKYGIISLVAGVGGIIVGVFTWWILWMVFGVLAVIMGIIGVNKDETHTLSIIGILFGILQIFIFVGFYLLLSIFGLL